MKKIMLSGLMLTALAFTGMSQEFSCVNDNAVEGRINGIEASGWREVSREFVYINYFVEPTPPYQIGYLQVIFEPDCAPGEGCTKIAKIYLEDATQINQNTCIWTPTNIH